MKVKITPNLYFALIGILIGSTGLGAGINLIYSFQKAIEIKVRDINEHIIYVKNEDYGANKLEKKDYELIKSTVDEIILSCPLTIFHTTVKSVNGSVSIKFIGANSHVFNMFNMNLKYGKPFSDIDYEQSSFVCLITKDLAIELYGAENPMGKTINVFQQDLLVIGIIENGDNSPYFKYNNSMFLPNGTVCNLLNTNETFNSIALKIENKNLKKTKQKIKNVLYYSSGNENVDIWSIEELIEKFENVISILRWFVLIILFVIFVIASFSTINSMLSSLQARKKEIGIRMAVGATPNDIIFLFIKENGLLFFSGSLIGILVGSILSFLFYELLIQAVPYFKGSSYVFAYKKILFATFIIGIYSILTPIYPALKASRLDPTIVIRE